MKARLQQTKPAEARPDIRQFMELFQGPLDVRSVALTGIFLLLSLYTLYFARDVFLPVVLAYILSSILAPPVRWLKRIYIAELAGAGLVLSVVLGLSAYGVYRLSDPAMEWVQEAPQTLAKVRAKLRGLAGPVEQAKETTKELEKMTWGATRQEDETVEVKKPGLGEYIFSGTQTLIFTVGVTIVLLYFLLASGDLFLLKLVKVLPTLEDKKRAVEICREIERDISKYLWTVTLVNAGLGIAVGLTMYFLGMPNPALWGAMAAFLNYIPYLGALIGIVVIAIAATLTFDDPVLILAAPSAYFLWQIIESYFITPLALGRSLALNPVIIFVWLIFWGWIWGVAGALLAVPLLAMLKIICHHFDASAPLAEFLGGESRPGAL